jgi:hypothetical protein
VSGAASRLYLVTGAGEIAARRKLLPSGQLVEAWPDLYTGDRFWIGETSRALLDGVGPPLPVLLSLDGERVAVYYGPRLSDLASLPLEESLRARVLSAHGIAVAWITLDQWGERTVYEPAGPTDPIFFLRRPASTAAHIWRLFRQRREGRAYMREIYGRDAEARDWAEALAVQTFDELIERHAIRTSVSGGPEAAPGDRA